MGMCSEASNTVVQVLQKHAQTRSTKNNTCTCHEQYSETSRYSGPRDTPQRTSVANKSWEILIDRDK